MYAHLGGDHIKTKTSSHVTSNNFYLMVGPGARFNHGGGAKTDVGIFFEAGWGNYGTYDVYRGDGDSNSYGGGILLRHDTCFGLYGEASLRAGSAKSDFDGVRGWAETDFDIRSTYYGGHLGLGYIYQVNDQSSWDFSVKGLWTHINDGSARNSGGSVLRVDDTDSLRTQTAVKYNQALSCNVTGYVKAAWEYEFDGKTKGWYDATRIRDSETKGSTGIAEVGVDWRATDRTTIGASVHGMLGQRRGFGGNLNVSFGF